MIDKQGGIWIKGDDGIYRLLGILLPEPKKEEKKDEKISSKGNSQ